MANSVDIGTRIFDSQSAAKEHFRKILYKQPIGSLISDASKDADLRGLVKRYDRTLKRNGQPTKTLNQKISHFEVRKNTGIGFTTLGYWLIRADGSATDFSFLCAISGKVDGPSKEFCKACRHAIALDCIILKKAAFDKYADAEGRMECELSHRKVTSAEAHLDHAWPYFGQIVSGFRVARGWSKQIPDGVISWPSDGQLTASFTDGKISEAFREFHHSQAQMRILSAKENLRTASLARQPKITRPIKFGVIAKTVDSPEK